MAVSRIISSILFALLALIAISFLAITFEGVAHTSSQRITFEGYLYDSNESKSLQEILVTISDKQKHQKLQEASSAITGNQWVWFSISQIEEHVDLLQIESAWFDHVTIYFVAENGDYKSFSAGDEEAFTQRIIPFRKPVFPMLWQIKGNTVKTVVIQMSAQGRFSLPLFGLSEQAFNQQANLDHLYYGAWIAILFAIGAYNTTIFISLRQNIHFYYILYVVVFSALLIVASGLGQQYLWPNTAGITTLLANVTLALTNFGTVFFVIHFISLKNYSRRLAVLLKLFAYISVLSIPPILIFNYLALTPILISSFFIMILIFPAAIYAILKGNRVAPFLLASQAILFPCNSIGLMRFMGLFKEAHWVEHLAELGMAADALILSIALAYQVNILRQEKDQAILDKEEEQTVFTKQLINSKENERRSIGKALHDSLGHKILSIKTYFSSLPDDKNSESKRNAIETLDEAIREVREISHLLYPSILEHIGLQKAVTNVVSKTLNNTAINYSLDVPPLRLNRESELLLFRAAQECVNNLLKHSDADSFHLEIKLQTNDGKIVFIAEDNGSLSFDKEDLGFGLTMLKQHAMILGGNLEIKRSSSEYNQIVLSLFENQQKVVST